MSKKHTIKELQEYCNTCLNILCTNFAARCSFNFSTGAQKCQKCSLGHIGPAIPCVGPPQAMQDVSATLIATAKALTVVTEELDDLEGQVDSAVKVDGVPAEYAMSLVNDCKGRVDQAELDWNQAVEAWKMARTACGCNNAAALGRKRIEEMEAQGKEFWEKIPIEDVEGDLGAGSKH